METTNSAAPKLTRRERQQQTRQRLMSAAAQVFARRGYHAATVPEIAAEAGCSTGALYSNFTGKEELFLTLLEQHMRSGAEQRRLIAARAPSSAAQTRDTARLWTDLLGTHPELVVLLVEFWIYCVRHPEVRDRMAHRLAAVREGLAELLAPAIGGEEEAVQVAATVQALAYGFAIQHLADPVGVPAEQFVRAVESVLRSARHS